MSKIISLEVTRPVLLPETVPGSSFTDEVTTMGRSIFDRPRKNSMVSLRPDDRAIRTMSPGADYVEPSKLRYFHASMTGLDTKHLGKKVFQALEVLGDEDGESIVDGLAPVEKRAGYEPLEKTMAAIASNEYAFVPEDLPLVELDEVDMVSDALRYPGKTIFVVRSSDISDRSVGSMLKRMSTISERAIRAVLRRADEFEFSEVVDSVPVASTRCAEPEKLELFAAHIQELLPLKVEIGPVGIDARL